MSNLLHNSSKIIMVLFISCTCATEQWKLADGDTDCAITES